MRRPASSVSTRLRCARGRRAPRTRRRALRGVRRGGNAGRDGVAGRAPGRAARLDGDEILAGARSVVCLARRYQRPPDATKAARRRRRGHRPLRPRARLPPLPATSPAAPRGVHPYARCRRRTAIRVARARRSATTSRCSSGRGPRAPASGSWARTGMLIVPGVGLDGPARRGRDDAASSTPGEPMTERCGACTRCLDACPTRAFVAPFVLDPRRCVSYLTIEHKSADRPRSFARAMGEHLFGCDDCQTVCPFNAGTGARAPRCGRRRRPLRAPRAMVARAPRGPPSPRRRGAGAVSRGTPLKRAGRAGLARNAAIVLGNRGDTRALPAPSASRRPARRPHRPRGGRLGRLARSGADGRPARWRPAPAPLRAYSA